MVVTSAQTITNELIGRISKFDLENVPSEFEAKLFLREAEKVKNIDPSEGWMLKGIVYSLLGRYTETLNAFDKSLSSASEEFDVVVLNYAKALRILGKFDESYAIVEKYLSHDSSMLLDYAYKLSLNIGLLDKANLYNEKLKEFPSYDLIYSEHLHKLQTSCKNLDIGITDLKEIHLLVLSSIYQEKKLPLDLSNEVDYENGNSIILLFHVQANAKSIAKMEWNIAEGLSEKNIPAITTNKIMPIIKNCQLN